MGYDSAGCRIYDGETGYHQVRFSADGFQHFPGFFLRPRFADYPAIENTEGIRPDYYGIRVLAGDRLCFFE
jgi:hypothetical protein